MNISVVGAGYVGLANALILGFTEEVTVIDIDKEKIQNLQAGKSPINDEYINKYINKVNVTYTTKTKSYIDADFIFIATNTDYDDVQGKFDVNSIENVVKDINNNVSKSKVIIIKSTVPIGYTKELKDKYPQHKIIFSPEFLREGYALYDNLYPDRIVVGDTTQLGEQIAQLLKKNTLKKDVPILLMEAKEAEVVKLFANTYLATRVSFVNELDTYCRVNNLQTKKVLDAIGYDHRIGRHYFNPSFGYGGYCLPKDTKQLKYEYEKGHITSPLITNVVVSNQKRKEFIVNEILKQIEKADIIGFYKLVSKKGINNFRSSATIDVINLLLEKKVNIIVYEPYIKDIQEFDFIIEQNLEKFKQKSKLIVANRLDKEINGYRVFTTDIYNEY
ncbi:MAG: nucleotide sugar dehydrogenase [Mycoplasmatales bacterium]